MTPNGRFLISLPLILSVLFFTATTSFGWPPTIGPELSFINPQLLSGYIQRQKSNHLRANTFGLLGVDPRRPTKEHEHKYVVALKDEILKHCPQCRLKVESGKFGLDTFRITFPNGYWFVLSADAACVEVQTQPLPYDEYIKLEKFIEENLYQRLANVGLHPRTGVDGHTNIGVLSAFPTVDQFAEFILDQVNHPELGFDILGKKDLRNSPPLAVQKPKQILNFFSVMDEVKAGKIKTHQDLARAINERVYFSTHEPSLRTFAASRHYQAWVIKRLQNLLSTPEMDAPIEVRYPAGRESFTLVLLNYELFIKRIAYLNSRAGFSNLQREVNRDLENMSDSEKMSRFYIYLAEMGEPFAKYLPLIQSRDTMSGELDSFVRGEFNWLDPKSEEVLLRYLPDLETSPWVRTQFSTILSDSTEETKVPPFIRKKIISQIENRLARAPSENKKVLREVLSQIDPLNKNILPVPISPNRVEMDISGQCDPSLAKIFFRRAKRLLGDTFSFR